MGVWYRLMLQTLYICVKKIEYGRREGESCSGFDDVVHGGVLVVCLQEV